MGVWGVGSKFCTEMLCPEVQTLIYTTLTKKVSLSYIPPTQNGPPLMIYLQKNITSLKHLVMTKERQNKVFWLTAEPPLITFLSSYLINQMLDTFKYKKKLF